jgi:membrane protein required for colicin V production
VNLYDVVVIVLVALFAWRGLRAGLVGELAAWVALVVGLALAFRFDGRVGGWFAHLHAFDPEWRRILGFVVILVVVEIVFRLLAGALSRLLAHIPLVGSLNRLGGLALGVLLALVLVWLVTASLLLVPHSVLAFSATVSHSETAHLLRALTPRWGQELRAYAEHFTAGHLSPGLTKELRQLTGGRGRLP